MRFVNNSTPRPETFCGVSRAGDHFGTAAYNAEWSKLLAAIDAYLVARDPRPQGTDQNGDGFLLYPPQDGELVTSIRWELLREGVEDYEYLLLANGGQRPATPSEPSTCDASVASAVSSPTSYTRDSSALKHLRDELGLFIEGAVNGTSGGLQYVGADVFGG